MANEIAEMTERRDGLRGKAGWRILIAGTGGQGVILTARLLSEFFVRHGHEVVSSQLHGMAQRGGAVQSTVIVDRGISPVISQGGADVVIGLEPLETARALPLMSSASAVFMNVAPIVPFVVSQQHVLGQRVVEYPSIERLQESIGAATARLIALDATALARRAGSIKTLNLVMLGCLFGAGSLPYGPDDFMNTVMRTVPAPLAAVNQQAFSYGVEWVKETPAVEATS